MQGEAQAFCDVASLSCEREPPPEADVIIDPAIRWGIRRALRAFLGGKKFKLEKVNEALGQVRITHDKDGTTRIKPADGKVSAENPYAMLETHMRSLENSIGRDLPWLCGLLPTRLDPIARKNFLRELQLIGKHRIATLEAWHEYEMKRL